MMIILAWFEWGGIGQSNGDDLASKSIGGYPVVVAFDLDQQLIPVKPALFQGMHFPNKHRFHFRQVRWRVGVNLEQKLATNTVRAEHFANH